MEEMEAECRCSNSKYLSGPSVHVEAAELLIAGQARILAMVVGAVWGSLHVEVVMFRQALLIVCLVGLGDGEDRGL